MGEGGVNEAAAVLAEGGTVNQTVEEGTINVVAGDQVYGSQENIHSAFEREKNRQGTATAMLAEGEHVDQRFTNCEVNVVAGDQIHRNVHNTYYIQQGPKYPGDSRMVVNAGVEPDACSSGGYRNLEQPTLRTNRNDAITPIDENAGITLTQKGRKVIGNPKYNSRFVKFKEKMTGKNCANFVRKMNEFSWNNIQGMVTQNYKDLTEPVKEYFPQMKTGFELFKGDYVPQEGFSTHCKPKSGRYIDFQTCGGIVTETRKQPCVIIGQPGSGKTIMMKRLARKFLTIDRYRMNQPTPIYFRESTASIERLDYDVVLHMNIRDIPNTDRGTLAEVIFSPSVTGLTKSEAQYGLKSILKKKTRIIMFFDGLDQATWEPNCDKIIGSWEPATTATIFGNILAGHLLSEVPITVSSREHSIAGLQQIMRPQFIAALVGFTDNDAMALYCEIMGEWAEDEWSSMRMSKPAMHYMCLTPAFLIFYMITRKVYPGDPPNCATGVMVCIIQIFLECENARKINHNTKIIELLNNLKKLAFQGTKEKRVVFDDEDLKRFNLSYEVMCDIIIKVPGLSFLGQKILEGMFRFFFSHQTLQEILSALRVVELDYTKFTQVVEEDFPKPYWSVVRSFTCGLLMNEEIGNKITKIILRPISDLEKKCEYLMTHLQQQFLSDGSPANKLEIFVALREANALDTLRGLAKDLDFSNMLLTPAMINTLCSVLKYIGEVRRLSLANSGMDEELLNVFVKGTRGLGIKVAILDIRGNCVWKDCRQWRAIFKNMTISQCFMDISNNEENETVVKTLPNILSVVPNNYAGQLNLGKVKKIRLNIKHFLQLEETKARIQLTIDELVISPGVISFKFDVWKQAIQRMAFTVQHCFVENPLPNLKGEVDVDLWIAVARAVNIVNVKKISLRAEKVSMTIRQVKSINDLKFDGEIHSLDIHDWKLSSNDWRQLGGVTRNFNVTELDYSIGLYDVPDARAFLEVHGNVKVKKITIRRYETTCLRIRNAESDRPQGKSLAVKIPSFKLYWRPQDVGRLISESDPKDNQVEISFNSINDFFNVDKFASGLNGFKIKELLCNNVSDAIIVNLVRKCSVENLLLHEDRTGVLDKIRGLTNVAFLSRGEFEEKVVKEI